MKYISKILRLLLFSTFFAYYLVALALSYPWINEKIEPLKILNLERFIKINPFIYLSTYPTSKQLKAYKKNLGIERIIFLLHPDLPLSRELLKREEELCSTLNLELVIRPVSDISMYSKDYKLIKILIDKEPKITLIHRYFYDNKIKKLKQFLELNTTK